MNIIDIITHKKNGEVLTYDEIEYAVNAFMDGTIKDYQMASLLMAITINGMTEEETLNLTETMIRSGVKLDLSSLSNVVDKHSTGGVGDKTTLVVAPLVASCGVKVAKLSGRSLGLTGGTIDKLESIPGFKTNLDWQEFIDEVKDVNVAIMSQTDDIAIADKKIYALRDVTATTESVPLIASSIMSKKIASGAKNLVLDVKVGKGAFIKDLTTARKLANLMKKIGASYNIRVICLITNMNTPLGNNVGNALEIEEVIDVLKNGKVNDLTILSIELSTYMVMLGLNISYKEAKSLVLTNFNNKNAYQKFLELVKSQGGDLTKLPKAKNVYRLKAKRSGYVTNIDVVKIAKASKALGAGRLTYEDTIDYTAGIILNKKNNEYVNMGEDVLTIYTNKEDISDIDFNVFTITPGKEKEDLLILEII